jgi:acyl carrier protein
VNHDTITEALKGFISKEMLEGQDVGLSPSTPLLEWGVINSMSLAMLVSFIKERFGVQIPQNELKPANLKTIQMIADLVVRIGAART